MTRQNRIHKEIRECEQDWKRLMRMWGGKRITKHNRKWWTAFNKHLNSAHLKRGDIYGK